MFPVCCAVGRRDRGCFACEDTAYNSKMKYPQLQTTLCPWSHGGDLHVETRRELKRDVLSIANCTVSEHGTPPPP